MATFVLVHGAWHGGWCWSRVAPRLRAAGHTVFTPTMTGFGERSHLLTADVGLETNVTDIMNVLKWEDLHDVILVAQSYAGMVTTSVADRLPERIGALIYINAFIPDDGISQNDMLPDWRREMIEEETARDPDAWRMPAPSPELIGVTMADRATITGAIEQITNRTFIRATGYRNSTFDATVKAYQEHPEWRGIELDTSHDAMITAADDVLRIFEETAASL
jgi:pimeloyl-ACP methyl ester carboxylesterase